MAFEAGRGGSGLEPKLAGLRLTPADFAGRRRRTPQDLGRILAGPGTGPSGPAVLGGPITVGSRMRLLASMMGPSRSGAAALMGGPGVLGGLGWSAV